MVEVAELTRKVLRAKEAWEDSKLQLDEAKTEYEYAEKRLVLARRELGLERDREDDWFGAMHSEFEDVSDVLTALTSVAFVGEPIGQASLTSLRTLKTATMAQLVAHMQRRGFEFVTDAPARELHGALVKQSWAGKEAKTNQWLYLTEKQ